MVEEFKEEEVEEELPVEFDLDLPRLPSELGVKSNFTAPDLPVLFVTEALPKQTVDEPDPLPKFIHGLPFGESSEEFLGFKPDEVDLAELLPEWWTHRDTVPRLIHVILAYEKMTARRNVKKQNRLASIRGN